MVNIPREIHSIFSWGFLWSSFGRRATGSLGIFRMEKRQPQRRFVRLAGRQSAAFYTRFSIFPSPRGKKSVQKTGTL